MPHADSRRGEQPQEPHAWRRVRSRRCGAQILQLQELFETPYFCQKQKVEYFELEVVLPIPFFERASNAYFNSVAVIDADGEARR